MRRWSALAAPAGFVVVLLLVVSRWTPLRTLDVDVADDLNAATAPHPALVTVWKVVSTVGQPLTFQVVCVVVALVLWRRFGHARLAAFTAVTVVLSSTINTIVKLIVRRDRPDVPDPVAHANGMSFPSGHAMASFVAVAVLLIVILPRTGFRVPVATTGVLIVLLVGFSRLALGVHYVSDVVGGWLLGATWVLLLRLLVLRDSAPRALRRSSPDRPRRTPAG